MNEEEYSLSVNAYTFAIMTLMKTNELARLFEGSQNFKMLSNLLEKECLQSSQIAYQVVCTLWILSYHEFTHKYFEDYELALIEKVTKIMDFFSKEKIARIILMLYDNIKKVKACEEHLSDIDAL